MCRKIFLLRKNQKVDKIISLEDTCFEIYRGDKVNSQNYGMLFTFGEKAAWKER